MTIHNIQDHVLTIDSDRIKLIDGVCNDHHSFDLICTLVEIDMLSMRDLLTNYRKMLWSGGRNMAAEEIVKILDIMINDVRHLCTRSPRLFRMSTRSLIAQSHNTRYGVDYGNLFVTLTTSEGIRKMVEMSASYYLSLRNSKTYHDDIRPKFLQMLVLLLSLLCDDDLRRIRKLLESTFQIPGDRPRLELLIMKVLPIAAIHPGVLKRIFDAYNREGRNRGGYGLGQQPQIWEQLQLDLAQSGYIVPVPRESRGPSTAILGDCYDLEALLNWNYPVQQRMSWIAPWPLNGWFMSTVFKYLQHDGHLRTDDKPTMKAMNDIPHFEVNSDDGDKSELATFTNGMLYHISAEDEENISAMMTGEYTLTAAGDETTSILEIKDTVLNEPFMEATHQLNILVEKARLILGSKDERKVFRA